VAVFPREADIKRLISADDLDVRHVADDFEVHRLERSLSRLNPRSRSKSIEVYRSNSNTPAAAEA
jgi:hypothetical protein